MGPIVKTLVKSVVFTQAVYLSYLINTTKPKASTAHIAGQLLGHQLVLKGFVSLASYKWKSLSGLLPFPVMALTTLILIFFGAPELSCENQTQS